MLRKRIIFSLIYSDGYFMQSRNFRLQKVGNLNWLEKNYRFQSIAFALDELIVLNASKTEKNITEFAKTVSDLVNDVFIPIAAGGGIRTLEDAELLFNSGADKIVLNSLLFQDPNMVMKIIENYGSQSVVASVDCKLNLGSYEIFINNGTKKLDYDIQKYLIYLEELGVGEIYLNSIDRDGTGFGYDFDLIKIVEDITKLPLIIAGGAGNENHLAKGLQINKVSAVATANLFNFIGNSIPNARDYLLDNGLNLSNRVFDTLDLI
ncbi:MAG TPA: imidazole glycerol phosphate synthase cyclase subunit [Chitinophagaceae bacterium]|nr:imidazole glycerol phosphate synthase cyclase subunit [Chitinophagaceae bacterium]